MAWRYIIVPIGASVSSSHGPERWHEVATAFQNQSSRIPGPSWQVAAVGAASGSSSIARVGRWIDPEGSSTSLLQHSVGRFSAHADLPPAAEGTVAQVARAVNESHVKERRRLALSMQQDEARSADVEAYARRYLKEFRVRQALFFHHISKTAGTFLCMCGWDNGCRAWGEPNYRDDCHDYFDGPLWGGGYRPLFSPKTCWELAAYNRVAHFTLEGNENYLLNEGLCPQFWNVIVLRHPIERFISFLAMCVREDWCGGPLASASVEEFAAWLPEWVTARVAGKELGADNYYIRSLLGEKVFNLPLGGITRAHLEEAKKKIAGFDMIYILGPDFNGMVETSLGWRCADEVHREGEDRTQGDIEHAIGKDGMEGLGIQNALDIELFEFGHKLGSLDASVVHNTVFTSTIDGQSCGSRACGNLCSSHS